MPILISICIWLLRQNHRGTITSARKDWVVRDEFPTLCRWCEREFRARRGGSPQRFCGARCRLTFWSALRRLGERALVDGTLTMADIRTGVAAACTLRQCTEPLSSVPETRYGYNAPPEPSLRVVVEVERSTVRWLVKLSFLEPDRTRDLAAILAALNRVGLAPSISSSA